MRKSYQTKEYRNVARPGTLVMAEQRHFFGSKMMEIEDAVRVADDDFDLQLKARYATTPALVPNAPDKATKASWSTSVDTAAMLVDYLYHQLLEENTNDDFTDILEDNLATRKLSDAVLDYVKQNLVSRYQMTKFFVWLRYYPVNSQGPDGSPMLQYKPVYSQAAAPTAAELAKLNAPKGTELKQPRDLLAVQAQIVFQADGLLKVTFKQAQPAAGYAFAYYYDVVFEKV